MYSVWVTMKFWFTLRTDFTYNIFKCWFNYLYFDSNKKYNAVVKIQKEKNQAGPIPIIIIGIGPITNY